MDGTTGSTVPGSDAQTAVEAVRGRYASRALRTQGGGGCCRDAACGCGAIGRDAYASLPASPGFEAVAIEVPGQDGEQAAGARVRARNTKRAGVAA